MEMRDIGFWRIFVAYLMVLAGLLFVLYLAAAGIKFELRPSMWNTGVQDVYKIVGSMCFMFAGVIINDMRFN